MGKVVEHFRNYCLFCSELIIQHMVLFFKFLFKTSLTFHIAILHIAREFDTSKLKRILQSLETGLFFCQIFVFII